MSMMALLLLPRLRQCPKSNLALSDRVISASNSPAADNCKLYPSVDSPNWLQKRAFKTGLRATVCTLSPSRSRLW